MTSLDPTEAEFLPLALQAMEGSNAEEALTKLGWWDLLAQLDDPTLRTAVFAAFRAQGRTLRDSSALAGLVAAPFLAQPALAAEGFAPGDVVAAIGRISRRSGAVHVVVGEPSGRRLLFDTPGHGAVIVDLAGVELRPIAIAGRLTLHEARVEPSAARTAVPEPVAAAARPLSIYLGRVAITMEILGAAERVLQLATQYAIDREQFGRPIGTFQAVRHLLAWGRTDCVAVEATAHHAVRLGATAPPGFGEVTKALAGRNGRRVCGRALQVFGGIGFTAEHDHHQYQSRVLALDALMGSSAELTPRLGTHLRISGTHPGFPAALMYSAATP